jgi:TolB-like protein
VTNENKSPIVKFNHRGIARTSLDSGRGISEVLCREQIERVACSVTFARADQLRRLLRWVGARSLTPEQRPPSEKEIAESVLHRKDFDPQVDSLVRKEMSRLREKISRYYQSEGTRDSVVIAASGGYLFQFDFRGNADSASRGPCWLVLPFRANEDMEELCVELLEELLIALSRTGGRELVSPATALGYRERSGDLRQFAAECQAEMVVEGSLRRRRDRIECIIWLVDGISGRTQDLRRIIGVDAVDLSTQAAAWLLEPEAAPRTMQAC